MRSVRLVTAVAATCAVLTCSCAAIALEGFVKDKASRAPVAGAFVVSVWQGNVSPGIQPATRCLHVELVRTDEAGRFRIPTPPSSATVLARNIVRYFDVYVPGMEVAAGSSEIEGQFFMAPRSGSRERQFEQVQLPTMADCKRPATPLMLLLLKAVYSEQVKLASTARQKRAVIGGILHDIEELELGAQKARENADLRLYKGMNIPKELQ